MTSYLKLVAKTSASAVSTYYAGVADLQTTADTTGKEFIYPSVNSGGLLVLAVGYNTGAKPAYTGWTELGDFQHGTEATSNMTIFYKATAEEEGTFDYSSGTTTIGGAVMVSINDASTISAGTREDDEDPAAVVPANDGSVILSFLLSRRTPTGAITAPGNMTPGPDAIVSTGKWSPAVAYLEQTTAASFDPGTWGNSGADHFNVSVVVSP